MDQSSIGASPVSFHHHQQQGQGVKQNACSMIVANYGARIIKIDSSKQNGKDSALMLYSSITSKFASLESLWLSPVVSTYVSNHGV
jgi:hypothetical protein